MLIKDFFKYWTYQIFLPGTILREKYKAYKILLIQDTRAHEIMAELEEIYYQKKKVDIQVIQKKYQKLAKSISLIVENLSKISPIRYDSLKDYFKKFDFYIKFLFAPDQYSFLAPFVIDFNDVKTDRSLIVGGKANNLSEIHNNLKIQVPSGFVVTTNAFRYFLEFNDLSNKINKLLARTDIRKSSDLHQISQELIACIMDATVPGEIEDLIVGRIEKIRSKNEKEQKFAVRSSAVAEDGVCSFAGQHKSLLNVSSDNIISAYKEVLASKYTVHALCYRIIKGIPDADTPMAVIIMGMVEASLSGVMYTRDIENRNFDDLAIYSVKGLGEPLVSGKADPFRIKVNRHSKNILFENIKEPVFGENNVRKLSQAGFEIENYYGKPQDIEWCFSELMDLYILQSRPLLMNQLQASDESEITSNIEAGNKLQDQFLKGGVKINLHKNPILLEGGSMASAGSGSGRVFYLKHLSQLDQVPEKTILVTKYPLPELVSIIEKVTAVVTDTGSTAGHFASVAREFFVPMLVNTGSATNVLRHDSMVTVNADLNQVFKGKAQFHDINASEGIQPNFEASYSYAESLTMRVLNSVLKFISPLKLTNPASDDFTPEACRSFHDILRFCHEKAVKEMFSHGRRKGGRKKGAIKLVSDIPMLFYVLDLGGGIDKDVLNPKEVHVDNVSCTPFKAVYKGLNHPGIKWEQFSNYDWASYDNIVMSGGIISPDDSQFGSYAMLASDYLNINLRFGYHFVILDSFCGANPEKNYILFRFSGGGDNPEGRELRVAFLSKVLISLGFVVESKGELVDGQLKHGDSEEIKEKLDWVGRLLGATRLMDTHLKDGADINGFVHQFFNEKYDFRSVIDDDTD